MVVGFAVLGLMALGVVGLLTGCTSERSLPVYTWETPAEAMRVLGTQNNGLVTFEAVLEEPGDDGLVLDGEGWVPCEPRASFHLYAWQHEKVRVDLEKNGKIVGSCVFEANATVFSEGREIKGDTTSFVGQPSPQQIGEIAPVLEAWVLYRTGIFRKSPTYQGTDAKGLLVWRLDSKAVTARVDPKHLTPVVYELTPSTPPGFSQLSRVELSGYQTAGGIAWPTGMKVQGVAAGILDMDLKHVKINQDLPPGVFELTAKAGE
jgi:hypothetical protein